jgi:hypothetical protein
MDDLSITNNDSLRQEKAKFLKRIKVSSAQDALRNALVAAFQRNRTYKTGYSQLARKPLQNGLRNKINHPRPKGRGIRTKTTADPHTTFDILCLAF